jgi:hypothetical protein
MSILQSQSRPFSNFKAPIKNRDSRDGVRSQSFLTGPVSWSDCDLEEDFQVENISIKQANTVKFAHVCKHYGIDIDEYNTKIRCPFKFHNDSSPSFQYFHGTNSFHCFGCKNSGGPVNFVACLEGISKTDAAEKLLDNFESDEDNEALGFRSKEKEDLFLKFSALIRNFLKEHNTHEAILFADVITMAFDSAMRGKGKRERERVIDVGGINHVISELEKRIGKYECP